MYELISDVFDQANKIHGGAYHDEAFTVPRNRYNHYNGHLKLLPYFSKREMESRASFKRVDEFDEIRDSGLFERIRPGKSYFKI